MYLNIAIVNPILRTPSIVPSLFLKRTHPVPAAELSEINIIELARALTDLGNRVTIYAAGPFLESEEICLSNRLTICAVPARLQLAFHPAILPFTPSLANSSRLREADVIQSGEFHQFTTFFASHLAAKAQIPFLVWQEIFHYMRLPGQWFQQSFELTAGRSIRTVATRFILRTTKARAFLLEIGLPSSAIGPWVPTGIDGDSFQPRPGTLHPEDFGFQKDCAVILVAARLSPDKGVDLAIRAVAVLRKNGAKVGLLVRGSGPELGHLKTLVKELGVEDCVRFLGWQSRPEMANLYNSSDLFLLPSRSDLFPFSLLEAGGCGLPSISTRVGSVEDFVEDGVNGLLVPPASVEAIATGIIRLLADDSLREAMGKEARRRFVEAFDMRVVAARLAEVYQDVLDSGPSSISVVRVRKSYC
jgi:glycosyltransferase involved in cell wall biosynthesis